MRRNTILLVALFAGVIAAAPQGTLKTRLGQREARNLAQSENISGLTAEAELPVATTCDLSAEALTLPALDVYCPCNFT